MKYISNREKFLNSLKINEVLENEITWGGSLIGRLINSTIRKVKIGYNHNRIDAVIKDLRSELDYLVTSSLKGDTSKKMHELIIKSFLEEIKDISLSPQKDKDKIKLLIGKYLDVYDPNDPKYRQEVGGIVGKAIKEITNKLKDLEKIIGKERNQILDILSDFADELRKLAHTIRKKELGQTSNPGGNLNAANFAQNFINVLKAIQDNKIFERNKIAISLKYFENMTEEDNIKDKINKLLSILSNDNLKLEKIKENKDIKNLLRKIKNKRNKLSSVKITFIGKKITLIEAIEEIEKFINSDVKVNESTIAIEPTNVKECWENFFSECDKQSPHRLTQREVDELTELLKSENDNLSIDTNKRPDPIISIVRILTNAYNIYATDVIPSGRPGGRVSQKTYREYIKLGAKPNSVQTDSGYVIPGAGPWAVKDTFNKYRNGVLKILQDQEYRKILSNIKFVVGGSEDNFNKITTESHIYEDISTQKGEQVGHAQALLEFLNDMINPLKLGNYEESVSNLINRYFGISIKDTKYKKSINTNPVAKPLKEEDKQKILVWSSDKIKEFTYKDHRNLNFYMIPCKWENNFIQTFSKLGLKDVKDLYKDRKVLFLNFTDLEQPIFRNIKLKSGSEITPIPIKISFERQIMANEYKEKVKKTHKITDYSTHVSVVEQKRSLHYGVLLQKENNKFIIIYTKSVVGGSPKSEIKEADKEIQIQYLSVIEEGIRIDAHNPDGDEPPKQNQVSVFLSVLLDGLIANPVSFEPPKSTIDTYNIPVKGTTSKEDVNKELTYREFLQEKCEEIVEKLKF